jgi:hypothetical protein
MSRISLGVSQRAHGGDPLATTQRIRKLLRGSASTAEPLIYPQAYPGCREPSRLDRHGRRQNESAAPGRAARIEDHQKQSFSIIIGASVDYERGLHASTGCTARLWWATRCGRRHSRDRGAIGDDPGRNIDRSSRWPLARQLR